MIVIALQQDGTASVVSPLKLYQGTDMEKIVVLSPFSPLNALQIGFVKPDGTSDGYVPMKRIELPEEYASVAVSAWVYLPNVAWTAQYGDGYINILALLPVDEVEPTQEGTPANYGHLTSFMCQVTIQEALLPNLPNPEDAVTQNAYDTILEYLAAHSVDIEELQGDMEQAQEDIGDLKDDVSDIKDDVTGLRDDVDEIKSAYVSGVKGSAESEYRHGDVSISKADIGLGNVDNTSDLDKPVSTDQQAAINAAKQEAKDYALSVVRGNTLGPVYKDVSAVIEGSGISNPTMEQFVDLMLGKSEFIGSVSGYGNLYPATALGTGVEEIIKIDDNKAAVRYQEFADPYWGSLQNTPFDTSTISQTFENGDYIYAYADGYFARYNKYTKTWSDKVSRYLDYAIRAMCAYGNMLHYVAWDGNDTLSQKLVYINFENGTSDVVSAYVHDNVASVFSMCEDEDFIFLAGLGDVTRYNKATESFVTMIAPWNVESSQNEVFLSQDTSYVYACYYGNLYLFNKGTKAWGTAVQIVDMTNITYVNIQPINTDEKIYMYVKSFSDSNTNKIYLYDKSTGNVSSISIPNEYANQKIIIAVDGDKLYVAPYGNDETGNTVYLKEGNSEFVETSDNPFQSSSVLSRIFALYADNDYAYMFGSNGYFSTYRSFRSAALWVGTISSEGWSGWTSVTGGDGGSSGSSGEGTRVYVGGEMKPEINFTSDPQTQINNKTFNRVYKSIHEIWGGASSSTHIKRIMEEMYDNSIIVSDVIYSKQENYNLITTYPNIIPNGCTGINGIIKIEKISDENACASYSERDMFYNLNAISTSSYDFEYSESYGGKIYIPSHSAIENSIIVVDESDTSQISYISMPQGGDAVYHYIAWKSLIIVNGKIYCVGDYNHVGNYKVYFGVYDITTQDSSITELDIAWSGKSNNIWYNRTQSYAIASDSSGNIYIGDCEGKIAVISFDGNGDPIITYKNTDIQDGILFLSFIRDYGGLGSTQLYICGKSTLTIYDETQDEYIPVELPISVSNGIQIIQAGTQAIVCVGLYVYRFTIRTKVFDLLGNLHGNNIHKALKVNNLIYLSATLYSNSSQTNASNGDIVYYNTSDRTFNRIFFPDVVYDTNYGRYIAGLFYNDVRNIIYINNFNTYYDLNSITNEWIGLLSDQMFSWTKLGEDSGSGGDSPVTVDTTELMKRPLYEDQKIQTIRFNTKATIEQVDAFLSELTPTMATGVSGQNEISTIFMTDGTTIHGVFGIDLNKFSAYGGSGYGIAVCEATSPQSFTILDIKYVSVYSAANQMIIQNFPGASGFTYSQAGWQGSATYTLSNEETIESVTPDDQNMKAQAGAFVGAAETELWDIIYALRAFGA